MREKSCPPAGWTGADPASEIKGRLTAREVFLFYGFQPDRSGFLRCPFHAGDRHGSLKVYEGDRGWHCFGCGRGGSVIDFVMARFGLGFRDACRKLNEDFRLELPARRPSRAEITAWRRARRREAEARERAAAQVRRMAGEHRFWWAVKQQFEPRTEGDLERVPPIYTEAVNRLPYLEHWLDGRLGLV